MRRFIALAASAAAVAGTFAVTAPANAAGDPCTSNGTPSLGVRAVTLPGVNRTFYVDDRNYAQGNGIWLYEETNSKGGLQRKAGTGSSAPVVGKTLTENGSSEICTDPNVTTPDTLYF